MINEMSLLANVYIIAANVLPWRGTLKTVKPRVQCANCQFFYNTIDLLSYFLVWLKSVSEVLLFSVTQMVNQL